MITITNLQKRLSPEFTLQIPSLTIADGDIVALIGPNGAGKSTLLRLIAGLIKPDEGSIEINVPNTMIGYQPQTPYIFKGTVRSNISLSSRSSTGTDSIIKECMLEPLQNKKTDKLSGGERQRVCLARILAGGDKLLLLDEPLSAADIETGESLCRILRSYCINNGVTLVLSTHLPQQAFLTANKFLILYNGQIAEYGGSEILSAPESDFGKRFLAQWKLE